MRAKSSIRQGSKGGRGGGTREELCAALVRVVARSGLDGVTYRSVAKEAGLSHGAASYHFATRDEMIQEALLWASRHSIQMSRISVDGTIDNLADDLPQLMTDYPEEAMFSFELVLAAVRRPELASDIRASYYDFIDAVRGSLEKVGFDDDLALARVVFATIDGLSIQHLIYRDRRATEEGVKVLQDLLRLALAALQDGQEPS